MTCVQENGALVAKPECNIVASQIEQLRKELDRLLQDGPSRLVIDLAGVEIIDSKGLALLMQCHKSLAQHGGSLVVLTTNSDFRFMFHAMRLDEHFSVKEAL